MNAPELYLTDEEKAILDGARGETMRKVLQTVVMYGRTFGATRLVPVDHSIHMVTSFGIPLLEPVFDIMDALIENGLKTERPFTVDPRPLDYKNVRCSLLQKLVFKIMYGRQTEYEAQLKKVGLKDDNAFTCTCYMDEVGNIPRKGDNLAWAESSAVVYANSVLGARCNRNSGVIELLCGIANRTPVFGLLTDEGRRAEWLIEVRTSKIPEAQVLGSAIGMKVMESVPYIRGLDAFLGTAMDTESKDYLKDMGAATASNGAVGLFHVENLTPEAREQGESLLLPGHKTYIIDDDELDRVYRGYPVMWKNKSARPALCFIGCPHLSLDQLYRWLENVETSLADHKREKPAVRTVLTAAPDVVEKFRTDRNAADRLNRAGLHLSSICPLMYMNNPLCGKQAVITSSNKLRTYTTARYFKDEEILTIISTGRLI